MKNLTGLVVSYNTKELLQTAIESLRRFYPELPILIVDSSTPENDCYQYTKNLAELDSNIERIYISGNIGHGQGMDQGIRKIKTKNVLLFDSDIEMRSPCITQMLVALRSDQYGIGQIVSVDKNGSNSEDGIQIAYLHPHFCIINRERYFDYAPFVHHGAPLIKAMRDINQVSAESELVDFDVSVYVYHEGRGTRNLNPPEFLKDWER